MKIKQSIIALAFAAVVLPFAAFANSGAELQSANIDLHNKQSLQRGAKYFVNYCQGCHSLKFSRYNRVAADLGLTEDQVKDNLIFTRNDKGDQTKIGSLMENALDQDAAAAWFGAPPPDLSLVGRSRSPDWIYSYLNSFYADPSRPMGVNNTVFPNVGMPHVLAGLQGVQNAVYQYDVVHHGHNVVASLDSQEKADAELGKFLEYEVMQASNFGHKYIDAFKSKEEADKLIEENTSFSVFSDGEKVESFSGRAEAEKLVATNPETYKLVLKTDYYSKESHSIHKHIVKLIPSDTVGSINHSEYKAVTRDITNFLTYVAEPVGLHRRSNGIWVMLFLGVFFIFAYLLKKEYWKDVH